MAIARLGAKAKDYSTAIVETLISERRQNRPVPSLAVAGPIQNVEEKDKDHYETRKKVLRTPKKCSLSEVTIIQ